MADKYVIREVFDTLQGEGARAGTRAVFVRFAGCNLWNGRPQDREKGDGPCAKWCDTDFFKGKPLTSTELIGQMDLLWPAGARFPNDPWRWCVLTGGEPALQLDAVLVDDLHAAGWKIAVETNGTINSAALNLCDHVCLSPKRGTDLRLLLRGKIHELKVILPGAVPASEGWTEDELHSLEQYSGDAVLYVQPQDPVDPVTVEVTHLKRLGSGHAESLYKENLRRCIEWIKARPAWRLSLQTHKLIGLP